MLLPWQRTWDNWPSDNVDEISKLHLTAKNLFFALICMIHANNAKSINHEWPANIDKC